MKCQKCGCEIVEGHLYCDNCGEELQIVPVFEPEIENSIIETLSTVAEEIEGKEEPREPVSVSPKKPKEDDEEKKGRMQLLFSLVTFTLVLSVSAAIAVMMYHTFSVTYQIRQAKEHADKGDYVTAVSYLEKAEELDPHNAEIELLSANYFYVQGDYEKAESILNELIKTDNFSMEEKEKAYDKLIAIYDEEEKYQAISDLLTICEDETIVSTYQHYMAMEPEFSYVGGNYEEVIPLKLSANTSGKIYYTLDGSIPTKSSSVYTAPIFLESGEYNISAFFVNDYGIESTIANYVYYVDLIVPDPPEVPFYSGLYTEPTFIEVMVPENGTVYYTTDGSEPTSESTPYTAPIPMPLGKTNFKFITVSPEGVPSEVLARSYELKLDTSITIEVAIHNVMQSLMNRKVLSDMEGHSHGLNGKYVYKFNSIIEIPEQGYYYLLYEYYEDATGIQTKSEHLYAVDVYTGAPNRLIYDEHSNMGLISLE